MRLTVDASVIVKWFVEESSTTEARRLLTRRVERHAPALALTEFANTIWKKARRGDLTNPLPLLEEIPRLSEVVTLHSSEDLIERAARLAVEIDHPVYDCIYIACAMTLDCELVTADRRLAGKAADLGMIVHDVATEDFTDWMDGSVMAPSITRENMEELVAVADFFERTERSALDAYFGDHQGMRIVTADTAKLFIDSPAYQRLLGVVAALDDQQRLDLVALGWLGASRFPDWRSSLDHAEAMTHLDDDPKYPAGYCRYWRAGYARATGEARPGV